MLQGLEFGAGFPGGFPAPFPLGASNGHAGDAMTIVDEFSTEDNNLLMSVLNSTPIEQQYSFYVPPAGGSVAAPPPWPDLGAGAVPQYAEVPGHVADYGTPYGSFGMGSHGFPALSAQQGRPTNPPTSAQGNGFGHPPMNVPIKPDPGAQNPNALFAAMPFPPSPATAQPRGRPPKNQPSTSSLLSPGHSTVSSPSIAVSSPTEMSHESATSTSAVTSGAKPFFVLSRFSLCFVSAGRRRNQT